jgi:putative ABC transport system permease protein
LNENVNPQELEQKFPTLLDKYVYQSSEVEDNTKDRFFLQPLTSIHLDNHVDSYMSTNYDVKYIYLFSSIALLILFIACINYINLTTARSVQRGKEVGMRKVIGANRGQLIKQFIGESIVLTVLALITSIFIILIALSAFNSFIERELSLNPMENSQFIMVIFIIVVFVGLFGGSYPAFYISAFRPVAILNRTFYRISKRNALRNFLVVAQFSITIVLIIGAFVINGQLNFIKNRDMGYDKDQILILNVRHNREFRQNIEAVKTELKRNPDILAVSCSSSLPNEVGWGPTNLGLPGDEQDEIVPAFGTITDYDFVDVYGVEVVEGRNFSRDFVSDAGGAVLINETAAKACRWESPIGKEFSMRDYNNQTAKIVGIVKDFHLKSLHYPIRPLVIILDSRWEAYLSIKINLTNIPGALDYIEKTMKKFSPSYYCKFQFFDETFNKAYKTEQMMGDIFNSFASLSIFIACLGLFGLASFTAEIKVKEIGIRKVLGASVANIIAILTKEFSMWMIVANVIAWPLAYFFLDQWLQNFAYRIDLSVWPFILSGLAALAVALLTVSYQTIKAAKANPVDSLRYE